ncbi:MAG: DUF2442 domain-containing protein [Betaproteobacteria bacterium]
MRLRWTRLALAQSREIVEYIERESPRAASHVVKTIRDQVMTLIAYPAIGRTGTVESKHGFWRLLGGEELFVPFAEFPWFRDAPIGKLTEVELPSPQHLYWPTLDIDLAVASIRHPEEFPLVSRAGV